MYKCIYYKKQYKMYLFRLKIYTFYCVNIDMSDIQRYSGLNHFIYNIIQSRIKSEVSFLQREN